MGTDITAPQDKNLNPSLLDNLNVISGVKCVEFVPFPGENNQPGAANYREQIMVYSVHGGDVIPGEFYELVRRTYPSETKIIETLRRSYCVEKDWGANQIAQELARCLGLAGYWRVNIARALLDFGRFPGITRPAADPMDRYAINYPFSYYLDLDGKRALLEQCFDRISEVFEREVTGKVLTLGIHSYDHRNPSEHYTERGTLRPAVSLIFRSNSLQYLKRMPQGIYDPLYPDQLAETTADRRLTARLSLMLERAGLTVSHNFPYFLPDGSLEVRSQVWDYFQYFKGAFEEQYTETHNDEAYSLVWNMLLDTNLRSSSSEALRSYLHMFRTAPNSRIVVFRKAQDAYAHITQFFEAEKERLLDGYRKSPTRQSSLAIEVRKDLVWRFHDHQTADPYFGSDGVLIDNVRHIAALMARAVDTYFRDDRSFGGNTVGAGLTEQPS